MDVVMRTGVGGLIAGLNPAKLLDKFRSSEADLDELEEGSAKNPKRQNTAIMFTDIVGYSAQMGKNEAAMVAKLDIHNQIMRNQIVRNRGTVIKTIGDAYMAVAGLDETATDPVAAAADLALDMLDALKESRTPWQIRIGIHVGPVVAGIIGSRKFAYDVWGDAVNVASRLESTSLSDRIQVSQPVAEKLDGRFELESRGQVEIKGKGPMPTWFVVGRL
jgi:adenylate cyclase